MLFTPLLALATYAAAAPAGTSAAAVPSPTVPYASDDPNYSYLDRYQSGTPEPIIGAAERTSLDRRTYRWRGRSLGVWHQDTALTVMGQGKREVADGDIAQPSARRRMGSSAERTRHAACDCNGGGGYETEGWGHSMHWHVTAEWGYVMAGSCRVNVVNQLGRNYLADVYPGDLWYFPQGIPHSIQGLNNTATDASSFLYVPHPLALSVSGGAGEELPSQCVCVRPHPWRAAVDFPSAVPTESVAEANPVSPQGEALLPYTFAASKAPATNVTGGSIKVVDSRTFNVSTTIAVAEVTVVPGGMRELHWHPTQPEWTFYLEGTARVTVFASSGNARTFDYQAGDIGYVPPTFGHYVENTGNTTMKYLEIFKTDRYEDISLNQWLALTPPEMVKAHLQLDDETISQLQKVKPIVVGPGEW
ncbi:Oxalate Decarboxylase [Rhizoctonia solani]|uniref:Oxalate Decarboxylase n=1 Tax=Rhizoctonia solani TaxID=456999 RepID=A0A8H7I7C4_9AGAM|nr:Oxalate Decarboxylase [Rhizoctonia solani]